MKHASKIAIALVALLALAACAKMTKALPDVAGTYEGTLTTVFSIDPENPVTSPFTFVVTQSGSDVTVAPQAGGEPGNVEKGTLTADGTVTFASITLQQDTNCGTMSLVSSVASFSDGTLSWVTSVTSAHCGTVTVTVEATRR